MYTNIQYALNQDKLSLRQFQITISNIYLSYIYAIPTTLKIKCSEMLHI